MLTQTVKKFRFLFNLMSYPTLISISPRMGVLMILVYEINIVVGQGVLDLRLSPMLQAHHAFIHLV